MTFYLQITNILQRLSLLILSGHIRRKIYSPTSQQDNSGIMHNFYMREKNVKCEHFSLVPIHFCFSISLKLLNILTKFTASQFRNHTQLGRARKERSMWTLHLCSHPFLFLGSTADHLVTWHELGTWVHVRRVAGAVEILWSTGLVAFLWKVIDIYTQTKFKQQ